MPQVLETIEDDLIEHFLSLVEDALSNGYLSGGPEITDIGVRYGFPLKFEVVQMMAWGPVKKQMSLSDIVLSHDFAKINWGEAPVSMATTRRDLTPNTLVNSKDIGEIVQVPAWKFHLSRLVMHETDKQKIMYVVENS